MATCHICCMTDLEKSFAIGRIRRKTVADGNCSVWRGGVTSKEPHYGVINLKMSCCRRRKTWRVHRLVYFLEHSLDELKESNFDSNDVSHICHNSLCVDITHLTLESRGQNCNRRACKNDGECNEHEGPNCIL